MAVPNENFKAVLKRLGISNARLAKALDYDPSLISRYLSGQRVFKAASQQMDAVCDYIISKAEKTEDAIWIKEQFEAAGLPTDVSTVYRFKQNLIMWLASDGETLRNNLGKTIPGDIAGKEVSGNSANTGEIRSGSIQIVFDLREMLSELPEGGKANVFLSSDKIKTAMNPDFAGALQFFAEEKNLAVNMIICVSGDTETVHRMLEAYLGGLISGKIIISTVHGITQAITGTMHVITENACMIISETLGTKSPAIEMTVREKNFIDEAAENFAASARYAQPAVRIYNDDCTREVIEILAMEYCTSGGLDVVKDSINPMFMSCEAFDRFLKTRGHSDEEFAWRSAEFVRFKAGMDGNIKSGVPFREIISLERLRETVRTGKCRMAGLYFAEKGYVDLDREGCADIIRGYINYMETMPDFGLLILDGLSELHGNNCWHIKRGGHVTINNWQGETPVMIFSDQLMIMREFHSRFSRLWEMGSGAVGSRANVIGILRNILSELESSI